jgi:hypothetical protein
VVGGETIGEATPESGCAASDPGTLVIRTTVGAAAAAAWALPACCAALAPPPGDAQPAAAVTATSTAAAPAALAINALVDRAGRRLPFPPNITGILPALVCSRAGDGRRHREITEKLPEFPLSGDPTATASGVRVPGRA